MSFLKAGEIFAGRYRIERELARGGMGVVYVAEHVETEQTVALKTLFPSILASEDAVENFKLEAKVAARLDSDHVVRVLDAGLDAETGTPFIAMELLTGQTLAELVLRSGPLDRALVASIFRDIAIALDRAHRYTDKIGQPCPIVHRDLKPENLFLARRPSGESIVKILDFGIAKVLTNSAHVSAQVKGTPLFMAYEQLAGQPVTPQTDIWSMGLIAFQLLAGKHYWKAAAGIPVQAPALFAEILGGPLDPPSTRAKDLGVTVEIPPGFDAWFARCVVRDPTRRFAGAVDAAIELRRVLGAPDTESLSAQKVSVSVSSTSQSKPEIAMAATVRADTIPGSRRRPWIAAGVGALLLAGAGVWLSSRGAGPQDASARPEREDAPSTSAQASLAPAVVSAAPVASVAASADAGLAPAVTAAADDGPAKRKPAATPPPPPPAGKAKPTAGKPDTVWGER